MTANHFVAFIPGTDGRLWELDGRADGPVDHGPIEEAAGDGVVSPFLAAACRAVALVLAADQDELRFSLIAMTLLDGWG